jgi:DNA polymerase-3 subunit delta
MASRKANEVEAFLRRPDPAFAVLLVYGPNGGLVSERARQLAHAAVPDPGDPFQLIRMDGDDIAGDPLRLADEVNTVGLFGGRRALWIRAGSRNLAPLVAPVLSAPPTDATVVIEAGDLQQRNPLRAAVEAARAGMALPCFADEPREVASLVDAALSADRIAIDPAARDALLDLLGADRLMTRRELEKLSLFARGAGRVTLEDIEAVIADAKAVAIDTVVDAMFLGQPETVDRGLVRVFAEGDDAGVVIGAALRHAMLLHRSKTALDGGAPMETVERSARLFFKRKGAFQGQLRRWTAHGLESAVAALRDGQAQARRQGAMAETLASRLFLTIALRAARRSS